MEEEEEDDDEVVEEDEGEEDSNLSANVKRVSLFCIFFKKKPTKMPKYCASHLRRLILHSLPPLKNSGGGGAEEEKQKLK